VAQTCLDATDRGDLYCMPQLEAKIGWKHQTLDPWYLHPRHRAGVQGPPALKNPVQRRIRWLSTNGSNAGQIKDRQWALADIDWDAPGTRDDHRRAAAHSSRRSWPTCCWIENIGARGFAALAKKGTPTDHR